MKQLLVISLIHIPNLCFGQITIGSTTFAFSGTSSGGDIDAATNVFVVDTYSGPGGVATIFRKNGYWYSVTTGVGITYTFTTFLVKRTVSVHYTVNPPDCALWQSYVVPAGSPGFFWTGYPSSVPSLPNGTVFYQTITGMVSSGSAFASAITPNYIDVATKNSSDIGLIPNQAGRLVYNSCLEGLQVNDGGTWKSIWPSIDNYQLNPSQAINFGSTTNSIIGTTDGATEQLKLINGSSERIVLGKGIFNSGSLINLKGSISVPVNTFTSDLTLTDSHHTVIHLSSLTHNITIPVSSNFLGRQYTISNLSSSNLNILGTTIVGFSPTFLAPNSAISIISDGSSWYKIN